jgi:hypothetical protein
MLDRSVVAFARLIRQQTTATQRKYCDSVNQNLFKIQTMTLIESIFSTEAKFQLKIPEELRLTVPKFSKYSFFDTPTLSIAAFGLEALALTVNTHDWARCTPSGLELGDDGLEMHQMRIDIGLN